jgi:hypothetical protein
MDVWDFFARREAECDEMSVDCRNVEFFEEEASGGTRGRIIGHIYFNETVYLQVHETVLVENDVPHRTDYAYFLIIDGVEFWGYERDPTHDPPVHRHTYAHGERLEANPISFKHACELAWREISVLEGSTTAD